jgi:hypothetical protein
MRGVLQGETGTVRWGYHVAATVGRFTIARGDAGYRLTASVVAADPALIRQRPLVFVMPLQHQGRAISWRWSIVGCELAGTQLLADLGSVEVSDGAVSICPTGDRAPVAV